MPVPDSDFLDVQQALAGQYSLERELGRGGMGIVYLAREVSLDRLVAIKVLPPALASRPGIRDRFIREARTAARLSHPNIVPIFRVGEAGPFVYFAMAYVDGETVGQRLRARGPFPPGEAARVLREAAWALAYAHAQGIVHRDVKPDNILLERGTGRALLTDFGIAHVAEATALTDESHVMGTAHFMSPEQAAGEAVDGRSDLYGLGVVGYLMLTGRLPFDAPTVQEVLAKHLTQAPPPLAEGGTVVPGVLARVVERCLAKVPDARWTTGEALADALTQASQQRRELPAPLRVWLQKRDPLRPLYLAWSGMMTLSGVAGIAAHLNNPTQFNFDGVPWWAFGLFMTSSAALPLLPSLLFRLNLTRRTLSAGYTLDDLRTVLRDDVARQREEVAVELAERDGPGVRLYQALTYGAVAWTASLIFLGGVMPLPAGLPDSALGLSILASGALVVIGSSLGITFPGRRLRSGRLLALRLRFWEGRAGRLTARVAGLFARKGRQPDELVHRPTELAIGLAADELFQALPRATRARLGDLPAVVQQLEEQAAAMRARVAQLDQLLASARTPERTSASLAGSATAAAGLDARRDAVHDDLRAAREQAAGRLATAVAALETIRLDLLRLQGGAGDLDHLTTMLDQARRLDDDVRRLADGHDAARDALDSPRELPSTA